MKNNSWRTILIVISSLLVCLAILGFVSVALYFGPVVEAHFFPILTDQKTYVTRNGDSVVMEITMNKKRACKIETLAWQIARTVPDKDGQIVSRSPISVSRVEGVLDPKVVYPPGYLRNGPFKATLMPWYSLANEIIGQIEYRCHPFWTTPQTYGPFPIPPA